jgi:xylulose-5-phosphate/fructose-6-phosphate phosphoketolase
MSEPLSDEQFSLIDAYWRASNYLTVGQIYLMANPLLREPLRPDHIKPRLLGHWGTSPGQNFIYVHLNRLIREHDANALDAHRKYIVEAFEDMPAIRNWKWTPD